MTGGNRDGEHAAVEKASGTVQRRMTRQSTAALGSEHTGKRRKTAGGVHAKTKNHRLVGALTSTYERTTFSILTDKGALLASHQVDHQQLQTNPGWSEQDPNEMVANAKTVIAAAVAKLPSLGHRASEIVSIGIATQRDATVVWDSKTGEPLGNAVTWADSRAEKLATAMGAKPYDKDRFRKKCGLPLLPCFGALKLRWLLDNIAAVRSAKQAGTLMFGQVDSWLLYKLCGGVHVTDITNAGRTMLMSLHTEQWDNELIDAFDIPAECLPTIVSNAEVIGTLSDTKLKGVPVAGCLGDRQAAMLGQGCLSPGDINTSFGAGCVMMLNTGEIPVLSTRHLQSTPAYKLGPDATVFFALEGAVAVAGSAVTWLKDEMKMIDDAGEIEVIARTVEDTGDTYFVPAFAGLAAPHWRPDARGCIVGMSQHTNRAHICRAVLESVCFQASEVVDAMGKDAGVEVKALRVDGGMTNNDLLMQLQADVLGVPVYLPVVTDTAALGAAFAAGIATGVWASPNEARAALSTIKKTWRPKTTSLHRAARLKRWGDAVKRSLNWAK